VDEGAWSPLVVVLEEGPVPVAVVDLLEQCEVVAAVREVPHASAVRVGEQIAGVGAIQRPAHTAVRGQSRYARSGVWIRQQQSVFTDEDDSL
jgi:hypothetical protein